MELLEKPWQQQAGTEAVSLLYSRDLLVACEMIPSFLLQIIHFLFWLDIPWSHRPVPLIISTVTCCAFLLYLQLHIKTPYKFLVFIFIIFYLLLLSAKREEHGKNPSPY